MWFSLTEYIAPRFGLHKKRRIKCDCVVGRGSENEAQARGHGSETEYTGDVFFYRRDVIGLISVSQ